MRYVVRVGWYLPLFQLRFTVSSLKKIHIQGSTTKDRKQTRPTWGCHVVSRIIFNCLGSGRNEVRCQGATKIALQSAVQTFFNDYHEKMDGHIARYVFMDYFV